MTNTPTLLPERIWIDSEPDSRRWHYNKPRGVDDDPVEYIRTDIAIAGAPDDAFAAAWDAFRRKHCEDTGLAGEGGIPAAALYWLKKAKDDHYCLSDRLFWMENAYNHVANALAGEAEQNAPLRRT